MKEELLHYVWRMLRFDINKLTTTGGATLEIQQPGTINTHAGPDFLNARVKIGDTLWAGHVEMHLKASDWIKHQHQEDRAYDNVILHVVYEEDIPISDVNGQPIPCLEMKGRISPKLKAHYLRLLNNEYWIPCQGQLATLDLSTIPFWLNRLAIERLEDKALTIEDKLKTNKGDWEAVFHQLLARSFGGKVNAEAMESLARNTPLGILGKHRNSLFQLEALLFGQAGLLTDHSRDAYPLKLVKEYQFLSKKYGLYPLNPACWKFLRLRPANFPTIRIAQLATLIYQSSSLFSKVLVAKNIKELENIFSIKLSNYWQDHYTFDKASVKKHKALGKATINHIIINTIVPLIFLYGMHKNDQRFKDKAISFLESLPAENNQITRKWKELGVDARSASESQALIQLKNNYCLPKRCLDCAIGNAILRPDR
jgi:hypothetical protein